MPLIAASSSASGKILTPKAKITPDNGSRALTTEASTTSRLETSPTSAILICTLFFFRISAIASKDPSVSALTTTPATSVAILIRPISSVTSLAYSAGPSPDGTTYNGAPASAPPSPDATIFTPAAAKTQSTELNLSRGSRISSKGLGTKIALM